MNSFFDYFDDSFLLSDDLHRKHGENLVKLELAWREWLSNEGNIFKQICFPPTAMLSHSHFYSYIYGCWDFHPYEAFELQDLNDSDALSVLIALESHIDTPLECWIILEFRQRFDLPYDFENDGETWPIIPQNLIDKIQGRKRDRE